MSNDAYYDSLMICGQCTREVFAPDEFDLKTQLCETCIHEMNMLEEFNGDE